MQIAVVTFGQHRSKITDIARGLMQGIESQGHRVEIANGMREMKRLSIYGYIAIGVEQTSLFRGHIQPRVKEYLAQCGAISGRHAFAFAQRKVIGSERALGRLMQYMEHEGMFLRYSTTISSAVEAKVIGSRLQIE